jgi:hypothetical protein
MQSQSAHTPPRWQQSERRRRSVTDSDIDLIKAAGKAAGLTLQLALGFTPDDRDLFTPDGQRFNPLDDDAQAFRLAVQLGLWVASDNAIGQSFVADDPDCGGLVALIEDHSSVGNLAATRRAIVRAAAAMAKEQA